MISIVDYGAGNLGSVANMLKFIGASFQIVDSPEQLSNATKIILPGVGNYDLGMRSLREKGFETILKQKAHIDKIPFMGICLGMQMLGDSSEEGADPGLGLIPGRVVKFSNTKDVKVPHMGWNLVDFKPDNEINRNLPADSRFYFVHSYYFVPECGGDILMKTNYGGSSFVSGVKRGNVIGFQFHPEKSHKFGMQLFRNFVEL